MYILLLYIWIDNSDESDNDSSIDLLDDNNNPNNNHNITNRTEKQLIYNKALLHRNSLLLYINTTLQLPNNPLDVIIDSVGGGKAVAEMTGRYNIDIYIYIN